MKMMMIDDCEELIALKKRLWLKIWGFKFYVVLGSPYRLRSHFRPRTSCHGTSAWRNKRSAGLSAVQANGRQTVHCGSFLHHNISSLRTSSSGRSPLTQFQGDAALQLTEKVRFEIGWKTCYLDISK